MKVVVAIVVFWALLGFFDPTRAQVPALLQVTAFEESERDQAHIATGAAHNDLIYVCGVKMMSPDKVYAFRTNGDFVGEMTSGIGCYGAFVPDTNFYCRPGQGTVECLSYDPDTGELGEDVLGTVNVGDVSQSLVAIGNHVYYFEEDPPTLTQLVMNVGTGEVTVGAITPLLELCTNEALPLSSSLDSAVYQLYASPDGTRLVLINYVASASNVPWIISLGLGPDGAPDSCAYDGGASDPANPLQTTFYDASSLNDEVHVGVSEGLLVTTLSDLEIVAEELLLWERTPLAHAHPLNTSVIYALSEDYTELLGIDATTVTANGDSTPVPEGFGESTATTYAMKVSPDGTHLYIANGTHLVTYELPDPPSEDPGDSSPTPVLHTSSSSNGLWIGMVSMVCAYIGIAISAAVSVGVFSAAHPHHHPHAPIHHRHHVGV